MQPVTLEDRKKELRVLLDNIQANPSHDWTAERARIVVLQRVIAGEKQAEHA